MKRSNAPLLAIIGVLMVMFVVPFILAVITLIVYGEFALPTELVAGGLLAELDANFVLALLITVLPVLFVWFIESNRRAGGSQRRSMTLTLIMLVLLMAAVTAVPVISMLRPLSAVPPAQAFAMIAVIALPLLLVLFVAALLMPEARRQPDELTGQQPHGNGA